MGITRFPYLFSLSPAPNSSHPISYRHLFVRVTERERDKRGEKKVEIKDGPFLLTL